MNRRNNSRSSSRRIMTKKIYGGRGALYEQKELHEEQEEDENRKRWRIRGSV